MTKNSIIGIIGISVGVVAVTIGSVAYKKFIAKQNQKIMDACNDAFDMYERVNDPNYIPKNAQEEQLRLILNNINNATA